MGQAGRQWARGGRSRNHRENALSPTFVGVQEPVQRVLSVRRIVAAFALSGLVAVVAAGVFADRAFRRFGRDEAIEDAKRLTALAAKGVAQPLLTRGLLNGDRQAIATFDRQMHDHVLGGDVVRIKVWTTDGRIVYSDEPRLIGGTFPDSRGDRAGTEAGFEPERSDPGAPENRKERPFHRLLEVYLP